MLILVLRLEVCNSRLVSILASCERLPATVPDLANRPRQLVFLTPVDSQLVCAIGRARRVALLADQFSVFRLGGYLKRRVQTVYDFAENSWVSLRSTCKI